MDRLTAADYARAEKMLGDNRRLLLPGAKVRPVWLPDGDRFWYRSAGRFTLVDPTDGSRADAFDHDRLAAALSVVSGTAVEAANLPFTAIEPGDGTVEFDAFGTRWRCGLADYECVPVPDHRPVAPGGLPSPDGKWVAFVRDHNLWVRAEDGEELPLTIDGVEHFGYGANLDQALSRVMLGKLGIEPPPMAAWSPDSTRLGTHRIDQRGLRDVALVESAPAGGGPPVTHHRKYPLAEDEHHATARFVVLDVASRTAVWEDAAPWHIGFLSPFAFRLAWWDEESVWFVRHARDGRTIALHALDPATGHTRTVVTERGATRVELAQSLSERPMVKRLSTGEVLWYSQRDGWGHLYLYDAEGRLIRQVTRGQWAVRSIQHVDEERGVLHFTASGGVPGDVYVRRLYRINLDGTGLELLSDDDLDHDVTASPSGKFFLDSASTVADAPVITVRDADGRAVVEVERVDTTALRAAGWTAPERFVVKADDGVTDIYGILWRPYGFDPQGSYPVIDNPYPGPQMQRAHPTFANLYTGGPEALAALGFAVVAVDGRGTPGRSKAFHDASYGNLGNAGFLEDHVAAIRQLGQRYPWLDTDRVGIVGTSGGGFATARALLTHPDFYRVGVSLAGNHDMRHYIPLWTQHYDGDGTPEKWDRVDNAGLAANLRGKLLLIHGELDDNVLPTQTMRLVDALIRENKDFDLLIVPGAEHGFLGRNDYVQRRTWDYFVRNLLGVEPPDYRLKPVAVDAERLEALFG